MTKKVTCVDSGTHPVLKPDNTTKGTSGFMQRLLKEHDGHERKHGHHPAGGTGSQSRLDDEDGDGQHEERYSY